VVVADVRVLIHVLQVADQRGVVQALTASGYQWLVHVQPDRTGTGDSGERLSTCEEDRRATGSGGPLDDRLGTADERHAIDLLGQLLHVDSLRPGSAPAVHLCRM
jgi:hypothetical protein